MMKYKKITVNNAIYINIFYDGTVSYLTVSTGDVLDIINNDTDFSGLKNVFEEKFETKVQEGYVLKYLKFKICQSPLGLSINQTDHIMKIVNEWLPMVKHRNVSSPFMIEST